ncbi:colipase-like protein 2 [Nannospalax galili]|uniref:colipase-like protein 2 n=1 Tax=Nannospalax galili TaxID=1026970 RepID=UPI0004ED410F|nr:colipase-like protein 2 [Nannospalax galili]
MAISQALAAALALLLGVLSFGEIQEHKKNTECLSDCCLMDLERKGAFCTSKSRIGMICLPQTKGALNIMCPCRIGLSCSFKDPMCPRRCQMF